jgi:hemerythrin-like domain-containing protein
VSSAGEPKAPARAIGIIRDEHRSLAAVLHAWTHALSAARSADTAADVVLMRAIVRYVQAFPLALHHPKEDQHLFRLLRERSSELDAELDELERQHLRDHQLVADLAAMVETLAACQDPPAALAATRALEPAVLAYASFVWEHVGREEGVILPAAQRHLSDADWAQLDAEFSGNRDPRFGGDGDKQYRQLFSRIVNAAPGWPSGQGMRSPSPPMT